MLTSAHVQYVKQLLKPSAAFLPKLPLQQSKVNSNFFKNVFEDLRMATSLLPLLNRQMQAKLSQLLYIMISCSIESVFPIHSSFLIVEFQTYWPIFSQENSASFIWILVYIYLHIFTSNSAMWSW